LCADLRTEIRVDEFDRHPSFDDWLAQPFKQRVVVRCPPV